MKTEEHPRVKSRRGRVPPNQHFPNWYSKLASYKAVYTAHIFPLDPGDVEASSAPLEALEEA
jgi:hypothetical protein